MVEAAANDKAVCAWRCDGGSISCGDSWLIVRDLLGRLIVRLRGKSELLRFGETLQTIVCHQSAAGLAATLKLPAGELIIDKHPSGGNSEVYSIFYGEYQLRLGQPVAHDLLKWLGSSLGLDLGGRIFDELATIIVEPGKSSGVWLNFSSSRRRKDGKQIQNRLYCNQRNCRLLSGLLLAGAGGDWQTNDPCIVFDNRHGTQAALYPASRPADCHTLSLKRANGNNLAVSLELRCSSLVSLARQIVFNNMAGGGA